MAAIQYRLHRSICTINTSRPANYKEIIMGNKRAASRACGLIAGISATLVLAASDDPAQAAAQPKETPASMVDALHTAFGEHHARAVHTKGVMVEGTFTPAKEARSLTSEPIFSGGALPIIGRFSVFAGVPDLPDNDDGASPAGLGIKIKAQDGDDFDIEVNQHKDFITATSDEFALFLRALPASGPDVPHPNPLEQFLTTHPHAAEFLASRTYPVSYANATYFGVNAVKFTNANASSAYIRYRLVPKSGEKYLSADERKAQSGSYLQEEIVKRLAKGAVVFDWYAQIAQPGDKIEDPSMAWPDSRKMVKLGSFTISKVPDHSDAAQKALLLLPGQSHPGVEPADPMLVLRNAAYPISFKQRQ
jgi:catalase